MATTTRELQRIHERLDELFQAVVKNSTACEPCRDIVMGNGKKPISDRVTALETTTTVSRTFILGAIAAASALSSLMTLAVRLVTG